MGSDLSRPAVNRRGALLRYRHNGHGYGPEKIQLHVKIEGSLFTTEKNYYHHEDGCLSRKTYILKAKDGNTLRLAILNNPYEVD